MAMAIRSALAKLVSNSIPKNRSGILMLRAFSSSAFDQNRNSRSDVVAGHYFRHRFDYGNYKSKRKLPKVYDYYMDLGGLEPARFAMEEFNKRKNAQLQFVRVIKSQRHLVHTGISSLYIITLEAVDAGVARLYQARVSVNFIEGMTLEWFCLLVNDGCPIALFDQLENFFLLKGNEDKAENQIPMCRKQGSDCFHTSRSKLCHIKTAYDLPNNSKMLKICGRWAVKTYNKEQNAQLEFLRVVNGTRSWSIGMVFLTLEAANAGVRKIYQAELFMPDAIDIKGPDTKLNLFGHVDDNGRLSILIDKRHEKVTITCLIPYEPQDFCRYKDPNLFIPSTD
ncbi:hypothetical protein ACLB2K_067024 [Fragaria x ananassa]